MATGGAVSIGIQDAGRVEGRRPKIERGSCFALSLDGRWSIIDTEAEYRPFVFCPDVADAKLILAALNIELPRRTKRNSTPDRA
jgi:hypothetical protein